MEGRTLLADLAIDVREQVLYMQELGVQLTSVVFEEDARLETRNERPETIAEMPTHISAIATRNVPPPSNERPAGSLLASLPSLKDRMSPRKVAAQPTVDVPIVETPKEVVEIAEIPMIVETAMPELTETIEQIRSEIGPDCTRCKLSTLGRSKVVNSVGNFNAELMFVGEAPGADEDEQGEPFVGRAGQLLTKIIESIGFTRESVFIGNINRCRPPGNRAPETDETLACKPFLKREIAVVRPKVIVVLGATAAQNLLETKVPIGKLRGQFHDYQGTKVMPTFHPAYLLRDPHKKREVWEDMKMVRDLLAKK